MKKFHIFLIVESILIAMAIMTILSQDVSSFLLILVVTLMVLRFYNIGKQNNFLLTAGFWLIFLIFMLNPYVVVAILVAVTYTLINHFAQVKQNNRRALMKFREDSLEVSTTPNQWIGDQEPLKRTTYAFDDVNIIRLSGNDTLDLTEVIVSGCDNYILIRKLYGPTQVIIPIDVAVRLDVACVYGTVRFLDFPAYNLRNETVKLIEEQYGKGIKSLKLVVNVIAGDVEVIRV